MPKAEGELSEGVLRDDDLLGRCTLAVRTPNGTLRGTGVLIGPCQVLTCAHVVEGLEAVEVAENGLVKPLSLATVGKRGNPKGPDDLAILKLTTPLPARGAIRFVSANRMKDFIVVGFPSDYRQDVSGKVHGKSDVHGWLRIAARSETAIEPGYSGSAVWIPEWEAAVGIVTHYGPKKTAFAVTTTQIDAFLPRQSAPSHRQGLPNLGRSRFVRLRDTATRRVLGSGFRLSPTWVLTARDVLAGGQGIEVEDPHGTRFRARKAHRHWPSEAPTEAHEVVIVQTGAAGTEAPFTIDFWRDVPAGSEWCAIGHGDAPDRSLEQRCAAGRTARDDEGAAVLELESSGGGPTDGVFEDALLGAPVFADIEGTNRWQIAGCVGPRHPRIENGFWLRSIQCLRSWEGFEPGLRTAGAGVSFARNAGAVERLLRDAQVREVVARAGIGELAESADAERLAWHLCQACDPVDLAEAVSAAYCQLDRDSATAERVFALLMQAVPAALATQPIVELPDRSSTRLWLNLLHVALLELALAASEDGPAVWDKDDHGLVPRAEHRVATPSELGPDVEGDEAAKELARELSELLAFPTQTQDAAVAGTERFIVQLATRPIVNGRFQLIDEEDLRAFGRARTPPAGGWRRSILDTLNETLELGTASGRRLYMLDEEKNPALIAAIGRYLPQLKIVRLDAGGEQIRESNRLVQALKRAFGHRLGPKGKA